MLTAPLLPNYPSPLLLYLDECQDIIHPTNMLLVTAFPQKKKSSLASEAQHLSEVPFVIADVLAEASQITQGLEALQL